MEMQLQERPETAQLPSSFDFDLDRGSDMATYTLPTSGLFNFINMLLYQYPEEESEQQALNLMQDWLSLLRNFSNSVDKHSIIKQLTEDLQFDEHTTGNVDLSEIRFNSLSGNSRVVTIEVAASSGILHADGSAQVSVIGSGTGTLYLTGRLAHIIEFLDDPDALSYIGAEGVFGDDVAELKLSAAVGWTLYNLGSLDVDIAENPELGAAIASLFNETLGTEKDDQLTGYDGLDSIVGLGGNDSLSAEGGNDIVQGDAGNDSISGGVGADTLDGGAGDDVLYYRSSTSGVTISLTVDSNGYQQASGGDAEGDMVSNFEHVYASEHADVITGDNEKNILFGYGGDDVLDGAGGNDVLRGGEGADTLNGGDGSDWVRYLGSAAGVTVDLNLDANGKQQASRGDAQGDVLTGFENIQGSDHSDHLTGDGGRNYIIGFNGTDTIDGGAGNDTIRGGEGADVMEGGLGTDTLQYLDSSAGVCVDLNADASGAQIASGGDAEGDEISGFENAFGSNFDDVLIGDSGRNFLYGYAGDDTLAGGEGKDVLRGFGGADEFVFDTSLASSNVDRILDFEAGTDMLVLHSAIFEALPIGALDPSAFLSSTTGVATSQDHRVIYDSSNGNLYYDHDGTGPASAVAFAQLANVPDNIDADSFLIV
ncbi:calcium-binding protein [Mameliella alba]|nr:calcium-binding protein [Mameliella alba]MBY6172697.1 calcium-binding protein [Mameliella alba]MBY6177521.1 calcium-binding protein [Mameliella alba]